MIGNIGSGKTTIAKEIAKHDNAIIISSDPIRKELFEQGKFEQLYSQIANKITFEEFRIRLTTLLKAGKNVVIDATNTKQTDRKPFIELGKAFDYAVIAVKVNTSIENCVKRVIHRQTTDKNSHYIDNPQQIAEKFEKFILSQPPTLQEGFDEIIQINND